MEILLSIILYINIVTTILYIGYRFLVIVVRNERIKKFRVNYTKMINTIDFIRILVLAIVEYFIVEKYIPAGNHSYFQLYWVSMFFILIDFIIRIFDNIKFNKAMNHYK